MENFSKIINFEDYGHLAWLWSNSSLHRKWSINLQSRFLIPPIYLNQYFILFDENNNMPLAYCSWAWMNQASEIKYLLNPSYLDSDSWKCGNNLWIIDFVSPFSVRVTNKLYRRIVNTFPHEHAYALRVKEGGSTGRILSFTGSSLNRLERQQLKAQKFNEFKKIYLDSPAFNGRFRSVRL